MYCIHFILNSRLELTSLIYQLLRFIISISIPHMLYMSYIQYITLTSPHLYGFSTMCFVILSHLSIPIPIPTKYPYPPQNQLGRSVGWLVGSSTSTVPYHGRGRSAEKGSIHEMRWLIDPRQQPGQIHWWIWSDGSYGILHTYKHQRNGWLAGSLGWYISRWLYFPIEITRSQIPDPQILEKSYNRMGWIEKAWLLYEVLYKHKYKYNVYMRAIFISCTHPPSTVHRHYRAAACILAWLSPPD